MAHYEGKWDLTMSLAYFVQSDYSCKRQPKFAAPTLIDWLAMFLIYAWGFATTVNEAWRKHLPFLSFHTSQATSMNRESAPFCLSHIQLSPSIGCLTVDRQVFFYWETKCPLYRWLLVEWLTMDSRGEKGDGIPLVCNFPTVHVNGGQFKNTWLFLRL